MREFREHVGVGPRTGQQQDHDERDTDHGRRHMRRPGAGPQRGHRSDAQPPRRTDREINECVRDARNDEGRGEQREPRGPLQYRRCVRSVRRWRDRKEARNGGAADIEAEWRHHVRPFTRAEARNRTEHARSIHIGAKAEQRTADERRRANRVAVRHGPRDAERAREQQSGDDPHRCFDDGDKTRAATPRDELVDGGHGTCRAALDREPHHRRAQRGYAERQRHPYLIHRTDPRVQAANAANVAGARLLRAPTFFRAVASHRDYMCCIIVSGL